MNTLIARYFTRPLRAITERAAPFDHPEIARMDQRMRDDLPTPAQVKETNIL